MPSRPLSTSAALEPNIRTANEASAVPLATYLAAVGAAVTAGMPRCSWVEATVAAIKPNAFGHSLELVDPAGGPAPAQLRAFLRTADRTRIEERLGTKVSPDLLVGMTIVVQITPEFHAKWHLGARITGMAAGVRDSLLRRTVEKVRAQLRREGLYDAQRRLPVPADVTRVVVIHPAGAAGYADCAAELARWQRAGVIVVTSVPARFEGPQAAGELAEAIGRATSGRDTRPDIVLAVRGGGDRAGLLALDEEAVARAVCTCPVPVITGLGHAINYSLCDEVAFAACDTPSKALGRLAALIVEPARRARADMETIRREADRVVTGAEHAATLARHRSLAAAERRLTAATSALEDSWAGVRAGGVGSAECCRRLEGEAESLLAAVLDRAPRRLDEVGRAIDRLAHDALERTRRGVERADAGEVLLATILSRARSRLDGEAIDIDRRIEASLHHADRCLIEAEVDVGGLMALAESLGLESTLARGFVLALARDGQLVPTRAAALAAGTLILQFVDGRVAAHIDPPHNAAIIQGEAA